MGIGNWFNGSAERVWSNMGRRAAVLLIISGAILSALAVKAPCIKPALGWNSYNCFHYRVHESDVMANAHFMADSLKKLGYGYVVVDFLWWIPDSGGNKVNQNGNWEKGNMDQYGRFWPDTLRFPSAKGGKGFKPLADSMHNLGLKFGIHLMRGVPRASVAKNLKIYNSTYTCTQAANQSSTCGWLDWNYGANMSTPAGQAYYNSIVKLYSDWGVDFLKIDDLSSPYSASEIEGYAKAIDSVSHEVLLSTSPGPTPTNQASHIMKYASQWRVVNDMSDNWGLIANAVKVAEDWRNILVNGKSVAGPGHWPDVDMQVFGKLGIMATWGEPHYSLQNITKGEHRVLQFLFCISNNPLIWGGNLPSNKDNPFYDSLLMNSDAVYIDQYGINGKVIKSYSTNTPVWVSTHPKDTTTKFLMLCNVSGTPQTITVDLKTIGYSATEAVPVRNVWTHAKMENTTGTFTQTIPSHDAGLYILGNGETKIDTNTTNIRPIQSAEKNTHSMGERVFFTTKGQYVIPAAFAGKTVRVSAFSIDGKLLNSVVTRDRTIPLYKNNSTKGEKVAIVKISEVQ